MLDHKEALSELDDLKKLRLRRAQAEQEVSDIIALIDSRVKDLVEYYEATDQLTLKIKGIGTCSLTSTKRYSIDRDDPMAAEAFEGWMRTKGDWELVNAVHSSKLQGYYKERLELNEELPPGVKTFIKNNIVIRG